MSDFKFACIHCGRTLAPDPSLSCQRINCPACGRSLVVPWMPAPAVPERSPEPVFIPQVSIPELSLPQAETEKPVVRRQLQIAGRNKPSQERSNPYVLALTAFILSLIAPFGAVPAIVCAHLARFGMSRSGDRTGETLATAALIIGYTSALFTAVFFIRRKLQAGG